MVFDLDPGTKAEERIEGVTPAHPGAAASVGDPNRTEGDRLGSVLTAADGSFSLDYEPADYGVRNPGELRPDLQLSVLAPEQPGDGAPRVLYVSSSVRRKAAPEEQFFIPLGMDLMVKAGLRPPSSVATDDEPAGNVVARLSDASVRRARIVDGAIAAARARMDAHRNRFADFDAAFKPRLLAEISTLPISPAGADRIVREGESPVGRGSALISENIRETVNSDDPKILAPRRGFLSLTDDEVATLTGQLTPGGAVPDSALAAIAAANSAGGATTVVQAPARLPLCRESTSALACSQAVIDPPVTPPQPAPPSVPGDELPPVTVADVPKLLARLLRPMTAPEEELLTGLTPAATRESVAESVNSLKFTPSPAHVPADHDFLDLDLAFEQVWQEAIDQGVVDLAENAYQAIVELGGDPSRDGLKTAGAVRALVSEGRSALLAYRGAVRDHRGEGDGRTIPPPSRGNGSGGVWVSSPGSGPDPCSGTSAPDVRDHRSGAVGMSSSSVKINSSDPAERLPALLDELQRRLRTNYAFTMYAANAQERSVNFGILNTFRQTWTPLSYQAGPLARCIPLAAGQTVETKSTQKTTRKRTQKDTQSDMRDMKDESNVTDRAEREIVDRASVKTNFSVDHSGGAGAAGVGATSTLKFGIDAGKQSNDTKRTFHEAVFKSAQEVRQERAIEITTETTVETEQSETVKFTNINEEVNLNLVYHQLELKYRVFTRHFKAQPVVLVAQEVPQPHEIDQAWLMAHAWILRDAIRDESLLPALSSISAVAGDETAIAEMKVNIDQQRCIVAQLREELAVARKSAAVRQALLDRATLDSSGAGGLAGVIEDAVEGVPIVGEVAAEVGSFLFGGDAAKNANNRQALQERANAAADQARDLMYRLEREVTALNALLETFTKALKDHHTHLTEIARLQNYVKDNILDVMQHVWRAEPSAQRILRLQNTPIPVFSAASREHRIHFDQPLPVPTASPHLALPRFGGQQVKVYPYESTTKLNDTFEFAQLVQVANLNRLLGFFCNCMIFPLYQSNPLTDLMMDPYVDRATGALMDPSDPLNWSLDEFTDYVCCLEHELTPDELDQLRPTLQQIYKVILSNPSRNNDVLVVPTNSLFVEALPSSNSNLEEFKRAHRMEDVKRVQGENRAAELRNILRAARILSGDLEDPIVDRKVLIQGSVPGLTISPPET
jgi:hypothetical protein